MKLKIPNIPEIPDHSVRAISQLVWLMKQIAFIARSAKSFWDDWPF